MKTLLLLMWASFVAGFAVCAQTKADKQTLRENQYREMVELLHSKKYRFEAQRAIPSQFRPVHLTSAPNTLTVTDSVAVSELPFFGRAYRADYGFNEGGIRFNAEMFDYSISTNDKRRSVEVTFKVKSDTDQFFVRVTVYGPNDCSVGITSNNRSFILFEGVVEPLGEIQ